MDRLEFIHRSHPSEFQGIVFVRLAFYVCPLPSVFVGRANDSFKFKTFCEVRNPSRWSASFHDNEIDFVFLENSREVVAIRCCVEEGVFSSFCVEEAAHGIELTKVKSESFYQLFHGFGVGML